MATKDTPLFQATGCCIFLMVTEQFFGDPHPPLCVFYAPSHSYLVRVYLGNYYWSVFIKTIIYRRFLLVRVICIYSKKKFEISPPLFFNLCLFLKNACLERLQTSEISLFVMAQDLKRRIHCVRIPSFPLGVLCNSVTLCESFRDN
jgi:hypothetical protein